MGLDPEAVDASPNAGVLKTQLIGTGMTRTVVIAGVGPGLGESLARKFAAEGCQVALFARSMDYIEELADDLPTPGEGLAVQTDLTAVDQIREGFERVRETFGPIDGSCRKAV